MSVEFLSNVYENYAYPGYIIKDYPDLVDQGMTKSVRATLEQFARVGQVIDPDKSNFSYASEFDDNEPLDSDRVNDLLERPDFTGMSEMEMSDYIRDNTDVVDLTKLQKSDKKTSADNQQVAPSGSEDTPKDSSPG